MEQNLTNNEIEIIEDENYDVEVYEETGTGSGTKIAVGLGLLVAAGVTAVAVKSKDKIKGFFEKRNIKKLEKAGYVVIKEDEIEDIVEVDELMDEESEEE